MENKSFLIYKLTSPSNKSYVGQTSNLTARLRSHKCESNKCSALSNAIKRYGFDSFKIEILKENLSLDDANNLERDYIKSENTLSPDGYNLLDGGKNGMHSEETKLKISKSWEKRVVSAETRQKISDANKRRVWTEESKAKLSASKKNAPAEIMENLRILNLGRKHSPETLEKLANANYGKKATVETKKKMSEARTGRSVSVETREKISLARKGVKFSDEHRANISAAARKPERIEALVLSNKRRAEKRKIDKEKLS